ncbi:MAG TPA: hypothetical protein VGM58_06545, partial [Verrucomicrobiae bacterium]
MQTFVNRPILLILAWHDDSSKGVAPNQSYENEKSLYLCMCFADAVAVLQSDGTDVEPDANSYWQHLT